MSEKKDDENWSPNDAIAEEVSSKQGGDVYNNDERNDDVEDGVETEVLIKPDDKGKIIYPLDRKWSPRKDAFIFSKIISFFWMTKLFVKGSKQPLEHEDLEGVMPEDCASPLTETLEKNWYEEAYDNNGKLKKNASLWKAIIRSFGLQYMLMGFFPAFSEVIRLVQPIFMGLLIDFFSGDLQSKPSAFGYACGLGICHFAISWSMIPFNYYKQMYGTQLRIAVTGLVYKKILSMSHAALARATTGKIVNLVSNDAFRFEIMSLFVHYLWIAPIEFVILTYLLVRELGSSAIAGVGVLVLLTPLQMLLGKMIRKFRQKIFRHSDERVKSMNEIITGMKVIKLYTWEESFKEIINESRGKEVKALGRLMLARASIMAFFFSAGALVSFITFMTYVLAGNTLTAKKVFTSVALFNVARLLFTIYLPIGLTLLMEANVAVKRIQSVLMEDEIDVQMHSNGLRPKPSQCKIAARNISGSWSEDSETLKGINFEVGPCELLAVVGPVGSGKSSLLMALLGELPLSSGNVLKQGKVVYASQEPWIFNGTIKYNITFGQEFDEERYNRVLKACALETDISLLANGDETLVGERGVSLSGGQKARVNLARAIYADADIYIMDDPLSAVDANVGRHLYDKCINGFLENKIRILVTHQMQYLTNADQIVALVDGRCVAQGSYNEIRKSNIDFLSVLTSNNEEETIEELSEHGDHLSVARRFSRQLTCPGDAGPLSPNLLRKRAVSFGRQVSCSSRCTFTESTAAVTNDVSETVVYEEEQSEEAIPKETKQGGSIGLDVYVRFFKAGYGKWVWCGTFFLMIMCQIFYQVADWWLSYWTNKESQSIGKKYEYRSRDLVVYAILTILLIVLGLSRAFLFFTVMMKTSNSVHMDMFNSLMRAPIYFFDTNSVGRILNRFSKDTNFVDDMLAFSLFDTIQSFLIIIGLLILVTINLPIFLVIIVPIAIVFVMIRIYYIKTARELKRIEGVARSPIFGHFSTTLLGLPTIRSFRVQEKFFEIFSDAQDAHTEAHFSFISAASWLSFNLDLLSGMLIIFCAFVCLIFSDSFQGQAGSVGLLLAYAISIPTILQNFIRQTTEVENYFTSVERMFEYCDIESEAPAHTKVIPAADWPKRGSITFDRLKFSYHRSLPFVLHSITAKIHSKEKIGVCGRTGAGKSSLLSTVFRTAEPNGKIFIDDQDILQIGLTDLRKKISIIPQEPMLFSGTLRKNLDPFKQHTDKELWEVLEDVQLKIAVQELPGKLDSEMAESGQNLSVGQRQLICLARAILKKNTILVVDEATANVDQQTDNLIQHTIRERFKDCTVLTIAHRLHTIMDSDRIMVLDAGVLKEFDEPYNLLRCKGTILYNLVAQTGHDEAQRLFEIAIQAHCSRWKKEREIIGCLGDCHGGCLCRDRKGGCGGVESVGIVLDTVDASDMPVMPNVQISQIDDSLEQQEPEKNEESQLEMESDENLGSDNSPEFRKEKGSESEEESDKDVGSDRSPESEKDDQSENDDSDQDMRSVKADEESDKNPKSGNEEESGSCNTNDEIDSVKTKVSGVESDQYPPESGQQGSDSTDKEDHVKDGESEKTGGEEESHEKNENAEND